MKEILITASIGVFTVDGNYYLQVITTDGYNFYNVQITKDQAIVLSERDNLKIDADFENAIDGYMLGGDIH